MNRVIALAWAVEPLALSVGFPPQLTFPAAAPDELDPLGALAFLSLPHPESIRAPIARTPSAALNRLSFKLVPLVDSRMMIASIRRRATWTSSSESSRRARRCHHDRRRQIQTQMQLWQVDRTLAAGNKAATLWQTRSPSPHAMALTAVDSLDLNSSGMGTYPLSARPFCPAPMVLCRKAFTAVPTWGSGYFEQTIS